MGFTAVHAGLLCSSGANPGRLGTPLHLRAAQNYVRTHMGIDWITHVVVFTVNSIFNNSSFLEMYLHTSSYIGMLKIIKTDSSVKIASLIQILPESKYRVVTT